MEEDRLARELGMGRTPVREAIKRLELEDLIVIFPRRGTFASEIQITNLAAISEVRTELEGHAAALAARRIAPDMEGELADLLARVHALPASGDPQALISIDAETHRFVYRCARNRYLEETLDRFYNLSLRMWHLALDRVPALNDRVQDHGDLLEAIRDRDPERARKIAHDHVARFGREIRSVL